MNDTYRGSESKFHGPLSDDQGIFGLADTAAQDRVDVHMEIGVFGKNLQLLVQHLQALLGNLVRHNIVDADLQVIQTSIIQPPYPIGGQKIAVRDQSGQDRIFTYRPDDVIQIRMKQRLAAAHGDDSGSQLAQKL